jgi:hypothetical protein
MPPSATFISKKSQKKKKKSQLLKEPHAQTEKKKGGSQVLCFNALDGPTSTRKGTLSENLLLIDFLRFWHVFFSCFFFFFLGMPNVCVALKELISFVFGTFSFCLADNGFFILGGNRSCTSYPLVEYTARVRT